MLYKFTNNNTPQTYSTLLYNIVANARFLRHCFTNNSNNLRYAGSVM